MVRCNRCGNENPPETFVCAYCAAKMRTETIEHIKYFERPEKQWKRPQGILTRFLQVFTNPSQLFWDLHYDKRARGGSYILFIDTVLFGVLGLILASKVSVTLESSAQGLTYLSIFLTFLVLGLIYHAILFGLFNALYRVVGLRIGGKKENHNFNAMLYSFFPSIIGNALILLVLLIALPVVPFDPANPYNVFTILAPLFQPSTWMFVDVINIIIYAAWIPLLASICIRSLHGASTNRALIGCYFVGIVVSLLLFLTRGTFFPSTGVPTT